MNMYATNRQNLMQRLTDGLIFLSAKGAEIRNHDVHHAYRQSSDFIYTSGIFEEGFSLLLCPKTKTSHLFIPNFNLHYQIWDGIQLTQAHAQKIYKTDFVYEQNEFAKVLNRLKKNYQKIYLLPESKTFLKKAKIDLPLKSSETPLKQALEDLRVFKSQEEIKLMKHANNISYEAHVSVMKAVKPNRTENEMVGIFLQACYQKGAQSLAYLPIFGSGPRAAILHYRNNDQTLKKGELLLVDAGCEWLGYASDITRVIPIGGRFSKTQAEIYDVVLNTQLQAIQAVKPGITMVELNQLAEKTLTKGLMELGFFKTNKIEAILENRSIKLFYPHGLGHMLGLDVHDVGGKANPKINLRNTRLLETGMSITIEPGLYFIKAIFEDKKLRKHHEKIVNWKTCERYFSVGGVRIEDNIVITPKGHLNLTTVPKERKAIEALMNR